MEKKHSLSFRNVVNFVMVNETKIISKNSVISSKDQNPSTVDKAVFKYLMLQKDDSNIVEQEEAQITKARINGKIDFVNLMIDLKKKKILTIKEENKGLKLNKQEIEDEITILISMLDDNRKIINRLNIEKEKKWEQSETLKSKIIIQKELYNRFFILKNQYEKDLKRLDFIDEGNYYLSQLLDVNCPICEQSIKIKTERQEETREACEAESNKLQLQLNDLNSTIIVLKMEIEELEKKEKTIQDEISDNEIIIYNDYNKKVEIDSEKLKEMIKYKEIILEIEKIEKDIFDLELDKEILSEKIKSVGIEKHKIDIETEVYDKLSATIKSTLESWKFDESGEPIFDKITNDIIIGEKKRIAHGKGYRAFLYAAFCKSLLNKAKIHPGFLIMDSPLTTLKEKDKDKNKVEENEKQIEVSNEMQEAFFKDLSLIDKDKQIIIIENKEPKKIDENTMKIIRFTKIKDKGRYGFFPLV